MVSRTFLSILEELGWPRVYLVDYRQFKMIDGTSMEGSCGLASVDYPIIAIQKGLRGKVLKNTIYHEIAHKLFPNREHWWIECAAERLAGGGGKGYWSHAYGFSVDMMPSRKYLLNMFRRAAKRFNNQET